MLKHAKKPTRCRTCKSERLDAPREEWRDHYCKACREYQINNRNPARHGLFEFWRNRAHSLVVAAVRQGIMPSLKSGEYACVDCGGIAKNYDHRDYLKPLEVVPVCVGCNVRRGSAVTPVIGAITFVKKAD